MDIFLPENRTSYFPEKGTFKIPLDIGGIVIYKKALQEA
jgi:hypothetical protein